MKPFLILLTPLTILIHFGCQPQETPVPKPTPESYLTNHQYQEAAWAFRAQSDTTRANETLTTLETILQSQPDSIKPWEGTGITNPHLVFFPNNVWGLFKQTHSDTGGSVKSEVAAYRIDQLLALDLTAMSILRNITLPTGETVSGSLTYFIKNAKTANLLNLHTSDQPTKLIFFDAVIANADRHTGNWMQHDITGDIFAIDHNRTFYHDLGWTWWDRVQSISDINAILPYYTRFKNLPDTTFKNTLRDLITPVQYKAFQNARKTMIHYLNAKIK